MNNFSKTLCLLTTSILLVSCSTKFNSREEAFNAKEKFLRDGKEVVVVYVPTDEWVEQKRKEAKDYAKERCETAKKKMNDEITKQTRRIKLGMKIDENAVISAREDRDLLCGEWDYHGNKESLTERHKKNTRTCNFERETNQFVCKERKVRGDEIMGKDWAKLQPNYTYFRY